MAQNITIAGIQYPDVPAIQVPKTGSGTATFVDTSDADAVAADIALNKTAYVNGIKIVGTSEGGGGTSYMETLWSNSSPASTFAEQTITLSDSIANYDLLMFEYLFGTSVQRYYSVIVKASEFPSNTIDIDLAFNSGAANRTGSRQASIKSNTTVIFGSGAYNGSTSNAYGIPTAIYGIKLTIPSASGVSF